MAGGLSPQQWDVVRGATRAPSYKRASPKVRKALIEALGAESNYQDLPYGDRDSEGGLQQRPSQGWGPASESITQDAEQFLQRAIPLRHKFSTAGQIAQAVQRSAFPGRYDERGGEARGILRSLLGTAPSYTPGSSSAPDPGLPAPQASSSLAQAPATRTGSVSQPLAPAFSAKVAQPAGYTAPPGVAPAGQQTDLRAQLADILKADAPPAYQPSAPPVTQGTKGPGAPRIPGVGTNYGRVVIAPGANRGGVGLQKPVLSFLQQTAGIFGKPIQITTGTNHNQFVAGTNRQSDHWEGNAVDIAVPVDGARGDQIATSALVAAGVSEKKAQQMASRGGLYNVNVNGRRVQVIWKTDIGGNHHTHVHVGVR